MEDFQAKATNPFQYDSPDLDWSLEGDEHSTSRIFFRDKLKPYLEDLRGKSVIDIGSGVGQLFNMLKQLGVAEICGLEPSIRNVETSKKNHPDIDVNPVKLEQYNHKKKFDIAISIMVFEHILDIRRAFEIVKELLNDKGRFYLIVGNKDFHEISRPGSEVIVQKISDSTVATKTIRPTGTMYDIFRTVDEYIESADSSGLQLKESHELISDSPRHKALGNKPICYLLIFEKI